MFDYESACCAAFVIISLNFLLIFISFYFSFLQMKSPTPIPFLSTLRIELHRKCFACISFNAFAYSPELIDKRTRTHTHAHAHAVYKLPPTLPCTSTHTNIRGCNTEPTFIFIIIEMIFRAKIKWKRICAGFRILIKAN